PPTARTRSHDRLSSSTHGPTTRPASSSVVAPFFRSSSSILSTPPDGSKERARPRQHVVLASKSVKFRGIRRTDRYARPARHENSWARPRRSEGLTTKLGGLSV